MTTVARQLPSTLSDVRSMSSTASIPRITNTGSTGSPNDDTVPEQDDERATRHAGHAFAREHQRQQQHELLTNGQLDAGRLRDEDRRQREIQRAAIEVEAVAGRHHERDDLPRHAELLHRLHRARQAPLPSSSWQTRSTPARRPPATNRRIGTLRDERDRQQDDDDEDRDGDIERREQLEQIHEDADAELADRVGDRGPDTDRRHQHHDPREAEHRLGQALGEGEQRTPLLVRDQRERDAEEHAEDDDLQHLALRRPRARCSPERRRARCPARCAVPSAESASPPPRAGVRCPRPARLMEIAAHPMKSASVVTISK